MSSSIHLVGATGAETLSASLLEAAGLCVRRRSGLDAFRDAAWTVVRPEAEVDLLIVDALCERASAQAFLSHLRQRPAGVPVLAILPNDDPATIASACAAVDDFLLWPVRGDELHHRIRRLLGPAHGDEAREHLPCLLAEQLGMRQLVGEHPAFVEALMQVSQAGSSDASVLLTGETGTGKEVCARALHMLSRRRNGPFLPVECGSIPEHLFESEVFGHTRGAFTDARSEQKGLVALARGGTLFLDEIDSLPLAVQGKLLRLLQEQTFRPLGSEQFHRADVRVIAATNRHLPLLVEQKRFRADLYFRLDVLRVHLPPLRSRASDIALLARHFLDEVCVREGRERRVLTASALCRLERHAWPGNVRELYNAVQRAALCGQGREITAAHISLGSDTAHVGGGDEAEASFRDGKRQAIAHFERDYVGRLLSRYDGNVTQAAREAGQDRRAFGRLAKKYGFGHSQL